MTFGWKAARLLKWKPAGVIGHVFSSEAADLLQRVRVPVVETAFDFAELNVPRVGLDDRAIGVAAAEHFLDQRYRQFVYVEQEQKAYSERRWQGFEARLAESGCAALRATGVLGARWLDTLPPVSEKTRRWILGLPRPIAAFAAYDALALELLEVARTVGLRVPEEIAVLGVGDIDWICNLAYPQLSSVRTAAEAAGFEAARLLDRLMAGEAPPAKRIEFPPLGVSARRSTDLCFVTDGDLARALRFIRDQAHAPIGVDDVVRAACVSRSTLERRFRAAMGRSPLEEIQRARIERVRVLLVESDDAVGVIAQRCGFPDGRRLSEAFRRHCGETPTGYRARFRCA